MSSKLSSGYRFLLLVLSLATVLLVESIAHAKTDYKPKAHFYQIAQKGKDCSIYRSVLGNSKEALNVKQANLKEVEELTHQTFNALEQCAKANGIRDLNNEASLMKANDVCSEAFEQWLHDGQSQMVLEEDVEELNTQVAQLKALMQEQCAFIVMAKNP